MSAYLPCIMATQYLVPGEFKENLSLYRYGNPEPSLIEGATHKITSHERPATLLAELHKQAAAISVVPNVAKSLSQANNSVASVANIAKIVEDTMHLQ